MVFLLCQAGSCELRVLYHDHCFDGAAAAAFFSRFMEDRFHPGAEFVFTGLAHKASQLFDDAMFDGDVNAIVDFKYSPNPRLTWWFDHHQSAFLSPRTRSTTGATPAGKKMLRPGFPLLHQVHRDGGAREVSATMRRTWPNWSHWADIIDGAQYADAKTAVELGAPAMKLTLVIEGVKGSGMRGEGDPLDAAIEAGRDHGAAGNPGALRAALRAPPRSPSTSSGPRPRSTTA